MVVVKNSSENEENTLYSVSKDIAGILWLDKTELKIEEQKLWLSNMIDSILKKYSKNKKLAEYLISEIDPKYFQRLDVNLRWDKDLAIIAIKASSDNFMYLDNKLKKDDFFAYEVIKSFIREGKNFIEVKAFIDNNFLILKQDLLNYYKNLLKRHNLVVTDDLTKNLINLSENEVDFFNLLKDKKIIIWKGKNLAVNPDFINNLEKYFQKNNDYKVADFGTKKQFKYNYLINVLWVTNNNLSNESIFIINSIINLIVLNKDKQDLEKEVKDKKNILDDDDTKDKKKINDWKDSSDEDIFSDRLESCLPNCSYSFSWGWYYNIKTSEELTVKITEEEKNNFTSLALKNFVKFYSKLHKLWLNFLWDKYKTKFTTLANNKFWFEYLYWEGITESKALSALNLIWKNIWVPEKEIIWEDWKLQKEVKCFKTLWEAELRFEEIKSSSLINGEHIQTSMWTWVVEKKLYLEWKIDITTGELFMNSW